MLFILSLYVDYTPHDMPYLMLVGIMVLASKYLHVSSISLQTLR